LCRGRERRGEREYGECVREAGRSGRTCVLERGRLEKGRSCVFESRKEGEIRRGETYSKIVLLETGKCWTRKLTGIVQQAEYFREKIERHRDDHLVPVALSLTRSFVLS
jgi:MOSC domain-containing protein YiiM